MKKERYFYVTKTKDGKNIWYNQDGKRVSKSFVKRSKKKVFYGTKKKSNTVSLIPIFSKTAVKKIKKKNEFSQEKSFSTFSSSLLGNFTSAISLKDDIYINTGYNFFKLDTIKARTVYSEIIFRINRKWNDLMIKFLDLFGSMVFNYTVKETRIKSNGRKGTIWDFSDIESSIKEAAEEEDLKDVISAIKEFEIYKKSEFKKSFKTKK